MSEVKPMDWALPVRMFESEFWVSADQVMIRQQHAKEEIDRLTAERDAAVADAERYRWLRDKSHLIDGMSPAVIMAEDDFPVDDPRTDGFVFGDELDSAIDEAMKEQEKGK